MSDERGWNQGGEHGAESGDGMSEAYREWQRQQQLQRPWDRQQPWQQEAGAQSPGGAGADSAPSPADSWLRPSVGGQASADRRADHARQNPDAQGVPGWRGADRQNPDERRPGGGPQAGRGGERSPGFSQSSEGRPGGGSGAGTSAGLPSGAGVPREDDFRPMYRREESAEPSRPQPSRAQPLPPSAFQGQPAGSAPNQTRQLPPLAHAPSPQLTPPRPPQPQSAPGHGPLPRQARPHAALPPAPPAPTSPPPSSPISAFQLPDPPQQPRDQPQLDGPPLPTRARHGGAPDSQESARAPQPDYGAMPTGADLPRISDPTRRGQNGRSDSGQFSTGQSSTGQFGAGQLDESQFGTGQFGTGQFGTGRPEAGDRDAGDFNTGGFDSGQRPTAQSSGERSGTGQFSPFATRGPDYSDSGQHRTAQFGGPSFDSFDASPRPDGPPRSGSSRPDPSWAEGDRSGQYPAGGGRPGEPRGDAPFQPSRGASSAAAPPPGPRSARPDSQRPSSSGFEPRSGTRSPSGGYSPSSSDPASTGSVPRQSRLEAGRAARAAEGRANPDIDLEDEDGPRGRSAHGRRVTGGGGDHGGNGRAGGNRKTAVIGGTVAVVVLALIGYFVTRPSGNSSAGATADPTAATQGPMNQPSATGMGGAASPGATNGAAANATSSATSAASGPAATGTVAVDVARVHVAVFNASGVNQRASMIKAALVKDGFALATVGGNMTKAAATKIYYPSTRADSAAAVAKALAVPTANLAQSTAYTEVTVVIGTDWATGDTYPAG